MDPPNNAEAYFFGEVTPLLRSPANEEALYRNLNDHSGSTQQARNDNGSNLKKGIWYSTTHLLPFCFLNLALACGVVYGLKTGVVPPNCCWMDAQGHVFTSYAVGLIVVSKLFISLKRFLDLNHEFSALSGTTRESVNHSFVCLGMQYIFNKHPT